MQRSLKWAIGICLLGLTTTAALAANPTLRLEPASACFNGGTVTINVVLDQDATADEILGGQFFLSFNNTQLSFVGAAPGDAPFTREIYESVTGNEIDYAVGLPDPPPAGFTGTDPIVMARLTFNVSADICAVADLVEWRTPPAPFQTRLTRKDTNGNGVPLAVSSLTDLGAITRDATPPTVTAPSGITVECGAIPATPTTLAEFLALAGAAASDACSGLSNTIAVSDTGNPPANDCSGSFTRLYTIFDNCGNAAGAVSQTITLQDTTGPTLTVPADANIECGGSAPAAPTGRAWGLYSNGGGETNINRPFASPLAVGDTFSFAFDNGWINNGQSIGFSLRNGSNAIRLELYYVGGNATFTINDAGGTSQPSAIPFGDEGFQFEVRLTGANSYSLKATRLEGNQVYYHSGTLASSGSIERFRAFNGTAGNGANYDVFVNHLRIVNSAGTLLAADNASNAAYNDGLQDGDNGGSGFLAWDRNPDSNDGQRGVFVASSQNNGDGDSTSDDDIDSFAGVSATDNCDDLLEIWYVGQTTGPAGCTGQASVIRTWAARDDCGNVTQSTQTFTFVDTTAPVVTNGPAGQALQCASAVPPATTNPADFTYTEACDTTLTVTSSDASNGGAGCTGNPLVITRTFTLADDCGNSDTWEQVFTISDTTAPTATQGSIAACYPDAAAAEAAALAATTSLTDNCGGTVTKAVQTGAGSCDTSIVVRVTDTCGNFTDYTYNTRVDNTPPTATQGSIAACYADAASAEAAALAATTDLTDNCPGTSTKSVFAGAGACATTVVIRVSDSCGNFTDYTYNTRVDNTGPSFDTPPASQTACVGGSATLSAAATDACGGLVTYQWQEFLAGNWSDILGETGTSLTLDPVTSLDAGQYRVVATDVCGNFTNSTAATLTVNEQPTGSAGGPYTTCGMSPVALSGSASNYSSVAWSSNGTGTFTNGNTLTATYNPSSGDVITGSVTLTLTINGLAPCGSTNVNATLTLSATPTANAGGPYTTCGTAPVPISGSATNYNPASVVWTTSGTGTFDDDSSLNTNYTPSPADSMLPSVTLTLTVNGSGVCAAQQATANATLSFSSNAVANAGPDQLCVCTSAIVTLNGTASGGTILWTTSGDGSFSDDTVEDPTYTPGTNDVSNGSVTLTLTVSPPSPCTPAADSMTVTFDTAAPTIGSPAPIAACYPTLLDAENAAKEAALAAASDGSCTGALTASASSSGATCEITITVTVSDACGQTSNAVQFNTRVDNIAPTIGAPASIAACYPDVAAAEAAAKASALAAASDNCPGTLTASATSSGSSCDITIDVTVSDACGLTSLPVQFSTRVDGAAPLITSCPVDIGPIPADAGACSATVTFSPATATDNCGMHPTEAITYWANLDANPDFETQIGTTYAFPTGTTTVEVRARDACGQVSTCTFDVTVSSSNVFQIDVQLQGSIFDPSGAAGDTFTRCIRFEFNCSSGSPAYVQNVLVTFSADAGGNNGRSIAGQTINVPCGNYTCVTAEDELHTLRQTLTPTISGAQWAASFTGADLLKQGDLYDDNLVDIADFGTFIAAWGWTGSGSTNCSTAWPHADQNADGGIGAADFAFIQTNFLTIGDNDCCGNFALDVPAPRTSIPTRQLGSYGLPMWVDLNADGVLDTADAIAFLNGVRPTLKQHHGQSEIAPSIRPLQTGGGEDDAVEAVEIDASAIIDQ